MGSRTTIWAVWAFLLVFALLVPAAQAPLLKKKKRPDLVPVSLTSDTVAGVHQQLNNVVAEIANQGKTPAGPFRVHFYLSLDGTITADDIDSGAGCDVAGLAPGESIRCRTTINLPASVHIGDYFLGVIVNDQNTVAEKDDSNNARAFGPIFIAAVDPPPPPPPPDGIVVDGDPSDWAGISPIFNDPEGDGPFDGSGRYASGSDLLHISVSNNNTNVYFLMEFAGTPYTGGILLFFDTDVDISTGCSGFETVMFSSPAEPGAHLALGDYRNCASTDDYPGAINSAVGVRQGHSFVEASVPIDTLFQQTPGRKNFRFYARASLGGVTDDIWPPTVYTLTEHQPGGANVRISFDSPSVGADFTNACAGKLPAWHYGMTLAETGGVGLHIISYKTVLYDTNGGYLITLASIPGAQFGQQFAACGAGSDYIPPNGTVCSHSLCVDLGTRQGGQIDMTFDGVDDKGNEVRFTSPRLILLSR